MRREQDMLQAFVGIEAVGALTAGRYGGRVGALAVVLLSLLISEIVRRGPFAAQRGGALAFVAACGVLGCAVHRHALIRRSRRPGADRSLEQGSH